jgi:hypothetical protein
MNIQELVIYCVTSSFGFSVLLYILGSIPGIMMTFLNWKLYVKNVYRVCYLVTITPG